MTTANKKKVWRKGTSISDSFAKDLEFKEYEMTLSITVKDNVYQRFDVEPGGYVRDNIENALINVRDSLCVNDEDISYSISFKEVK